MAPEQLRELLRRRPFKPFTITMSDGRRTFEVSDPSQALVTSHTTAVAIPGKSGDYESFSLLANEHITSAESDDGAPSVVCG